MTLIIVITLVVGAFAAGILVGRYYIPDDRPLRRSASHARSYIRALNRLLSRDRDGAIDDLTEVVEDNTEDVEPYFALGSLFRQRGEWERAVRVHQGIELRENGDREVRQRARYELGLDFRAAGMPRRATKAMEDCLAEDPKHEGALRALGSLYEEQGRFSEAAEACARLPEERDADRIRQHHLYCAGAQRAIEEGELGQAKSLLKQALRIEENTSHALITGAELDAAKQDWQRASDKIVRALSGEPQLASFLVGALLSTQVEVAAASEQVEETEIVEVARRKTLELLDAVGLEGRSPVEEGTFVVAREEERALSDTELAIEKLEEFRARCPEFLPASLLALQLSSQAADQVTNFEIPDMLREGHWTCRRCYYQEAEFFWRCDHCREWGGAERRIGAVRDPLRERREGSRGERLTADGLPKNSLERTSSAPGPLLPGGSKILGKARNWFAERLGRGKTSGN